MMSRNDCVMPKQGRWLYSVQCTYRLVNIEYSIANTVQVIIIHTEDSFITQALYEKQTQMVEIVSTK